MPNSTAHDRPEWPGVAIVVLAVIAALLPPVAKTAAEDRPAAPQAPPLTTEPFEQAGQVDAASFMLAINHGYFFTADSRAFVIKTRRDHVRVWEAGTLKRLTEPLEQPELRVYSLTADGRSLFTTGGGEVRIWDVAASKSRAVVKASSERIHFFDAGRDGRQFLTVLSDRRTMIVWNAAAERPTEVYHLWYARGLDSAQFDPTGTYIVNKESGGPFHLLRADAGREACPPIEAYADRGLSSAPYRAQFDPAGRRLAVPLRWGFRLLECGLGKAVAEAHWDADLETRHISFSPDGSLVAITTWDWRKLENGPLFVFDAATAQRVHEFGSRVFFSCQIGPGGRFALCDEKDQGPELLDLRNGVRVQTFPSTREVSHAAVMSPDGETILVHSGSGIISVWCLRHGDPATRP